MACPTQAARFQAQDVGAILARAAQAGVKVLDTAANYGEAEAVLARQNLAPFRTVTKTISVKDGVEAVVARARQSAAALKADTLLVHAVADLENPDLWPALQRLKAEGVFRKIGISAYVADNPAGPRRAIQTRHDAASFQPAGSTAAARWRIGASSRTSAWKSTPARCSCKAFCSWNKCRKSCAHVEVALADIRSRIPLMPVQRPWPQPWRLPCPVQRSMSRWSGSQGCPSWKKFWRPPRCPYPLWTGPRWR